MKLLLLTIYALVLGALAKTEPCLGPRCKRMIWARYKDYDYGDTGTNDGDTNRPQNIPNGMRGQQNYYDDGDTEGKNGDTNLKQNNGYGRPQGGRTNENIPNGMRGQQNYYDDGETENKNGDTNEKQNNGYGRPQGGRTNENIIPNRWSNCPNCYAEDFGNGEYNHNTINIEKK